MEHPAGSYIVYAGQAFRPHVVNLMEPRDYPERQRVEAALADRAYLDEETLESLEEGREGAIMENLVKGAVLTVYLPEGFASA